MAVTSTQSAENLETPSHQVTQHVQVVIFNTDNQEDNSSST